MAQPRTVGLTGHQRDKIHNIKSIEKRLKLYTKYVHKDSVRYLREVNRYWQKKTDSLNKTIVARENAIRAKGKAVNKKTAARLEQKIYKPWALKQSQKQVAWLDQHEFIIPANTRIMLLNYWRDYFLKATKNDSMLLAVKEKMPGLPLPKQLNSKLQTHKILNAKNINKPDLRQLANGKLGSIEGVDKLKNLQTNGKAYTSKFNKYSQQAKSIPETDLRGVAMTKAESAATGYASGVEGFSELNKAQGEINKLKGMPGQYQTQAGQLQDSTYLKEQAKKKAEEMAMDYITQNPEIMEGVHRKMAVLMKKYSFVPNSNDLSTAIKASSLKGKTIKERLVFAGNFQVLSWDPFTIDFSPSVGYKFNRKFVVGVGGNYRQTFSTDTIPKLAPEVMGYKAFVSHDLLRNFFAYGEFDRNSPGVKSNENGSSRIWRNAAFAGIGRKMTVHPKVEMTVIMMYNFLHKPNDPVYPRPFVVKVGFQTSEIAMLKKK